MIVRTLGLRLREAAYDLEQIWTGLARLLTLPEGLYRQYASPQVVSSLWYGSSSATMCNSLGEAWLCLPTDLFEPMKKVTSNLKQGVNSAVYPRLVLTCRLHTRRVISW